MREQYCSECGLLREYAKEGHLRKCPESPPGEIPRWETDDDAEDEWSAMAITWYKHYMNIQIDHLVSQYRSQSIRKRVDTSAPIEQAMEDRAPGAKQEIDGL